MNITLKFFGCVLILILLIVGIITYYYISHDRLCNKMTEGEFSQYWIEHNDFINISQKSYCSQYLT